MKSGSRTNALMVGLALSFAFGAAVTTQAQTREKYLISAAAGGINFVSGNVTVMRKKTNRQEALTEADDLKTGDTVTTGVGGRVEVLLNPGSYLRIDENSEFELSDASLDSLLVTLIKGSAVVEVTGADGVDLAIGFKTPQTDALIVNGGIYRFNVLPNETTEILVRKGRLYYAKDASNELKGGRKVVISRGRVEVAKLDKKDQDSLDLWSKTRAELLARANRKLQDRPLMTAFNDFGWYDPRGWIRPMGYQPVGLWVYNPTVRSHCFIPVGGRSWSSPYGHHYGTGIGFNGSGGDWRRGDGHQPGGNGSPTSGNGSGSNGGNTGGSTNPSPAPQPVSQPPSPPSPPMSTPQVDREPRKVYTDQSPK